MEQPIDPATRPWQEKIRDNPIRWVQFLYSELEEVIGYAYLVGNVKLLTAARAAIRRRDNDTRPSPTPGWSSPYR